MEEESLTLPMLSIVFHLLLLDMFGSECRGLNVRGTLDLFSESIGEHRDTPLPYTHTHTHNFLSTDHEHVEL